MHQIQLVVTPATKRLALRINQYFNPELYPTEKPITLKDIWKENVSYFEKITDVAAIIKAITINPIVKEK